MLCVHAPLYKFFKAQQKCIAKMDARKAEAAQLIYDKYIQIGRQHIIILPPYFYHCKLVIVLQYLLEKKSQNFTSLAEEAILKCHLTH